MINASAVNPDPSPAADVAILDTLEALQGEIDAEEAANLRGPKLPLQRRRCKTRRDKARARRARRGGRS
jgi:hypothetical protein